LKYKFYLLTVLIVGSITFCTYGQVDRGGIPRSFGLLSVQKSQLQIIDVTPPDLPALQKEDLDDASLEKSYRVGVEIPVFVTTASYGDWYELPAGGRIWRATISCNGAKALGLNYNDLKLPHGADLFVYTPDHKLVIGALTAAEIPNKQVFTTRPLPGDEVTLEYYEPPNSNAGAAFVITGIVYMYRGIEENGVVSATSSPTGSCEVNVNCEEGQNWQEQRDGVVKILTKVGTKYFYCSGSVLNNTKQDFSGLLLTASHCSKDFSGAVASDLDYSRWIFYFNYESPGCITTSITPLTVVGAEKLATSDTPSDMGSDFVLLRTLISIPAKYNPYYCGWDADGRNSPSGVCIHHPDGEIKKISTYTSPLGSGSFGGTSPGTHWIVTWSATPNGYGVTEGGSSGAPLFNDDGLIIGTLTGGESSCQNPGGEDVFGKFSYSWQSNGALPSQQLKPWLDPDNTGILKMPGSYNNNLAIANFSADTKLIPVGGTTNFQDLSTGKPDHWHWYFQGAEPSESLEQNPTGIRFDHFGKMNVKLVVQNSYNSDTLVKLEYIDVKAVISPNPSPDGIINILTDANSNEDLLIDVYDFQGKIAQRFKYVGTNSSTYTIRLPQGGNAYMLWIKQGNNIQTQKVIVVR
jgi:PKD repeat protein